MSRRNLLISVGASALLIGFVIAGALAQEETTPPQPQPAGPRGGMQRSPEEMRQRSLDMLKEALGASDEEWKVLGPRVEKVQTLSRQVRTGGMMGMFGMFGGQGQGGGQGKGRN